MVLVVSVCAMSFLVMCDVFGVQNKDESTDSPPLLNKHVEEHTSCLVWLLFH